MIDTGIGAKAISTSSELSVTLVVAADCPGCGYNRYQSHHKDGIWPSLFVVRTKTALVLYLHSQDRKRKNGTSAAPATAFASRVLPGTGRTKQRSFRNFAL
jgi:hypothetical protein